MRLHLISTPPPPGTFHLVRVDYSDFDGPPEDQFIWELEPSAQVVQPRQTPHPESGVEADAARAISMRSRGQCDGQPCSPFFLQTRRNPARFPSPLAAPLHGAVQAEDYQLVPLAKALRMPRISLFIADDVGLGKTIEAGLILAELILRRRVRRILILCPASLRGQWQQEMAEKFALNFDLVDRPSTDRAASAARPRRESLADVLEDHRVVSLPEAAGRAGGVPGRRRKRNRAAPICRGIS